jgi:hypothetical protein
MRKLRRILLGFFQSIKRRKYCGSKIGSIADCEQNSNAKSQFGRRNDVIRNADGAFINRHGILTGYIHTKSGIISRPVGSISVSEDGF